MIWITAITIAAAPATTKESLKVSMTDVSQGVVNSGYVETQVLRSSG